MIWPFKPHAPLPLASKVTCERRFVAVARMLQQRPLVIPAPITPQEFDPIIAGCDDDQLAERVFQFIAGRVLPHTKINVDWADDEALTAEDKTFLYRIVQGGENSASVCFHRSLIESPYRLAAVAATAAAELLWRSKPAATVPKGGLEVLPVFFGLGPLMANAALHEATETDQTSLLHMHTWSRNGEVSSLEHGYTMALADFSLSSGYEAVAGQLRPDAQEGLQKGIRFLAKTSDCSVQREFLSTAPDVSTSECIAQLQARSYSVQLSTILDLFSQGSIKEELIPTVASLLNHRELDIQQIATLTLGRCDTLSRSLHDELLIQAQNGPVTLRRAAISSLRPGYENDDSVQELLTETLSRGDAATATACIRTFLKYETHPPDLSDAVLAALKKMVLKSGTDELSDGLKLLKKVHDDPSQAVQQTFADDPSALAIFDELLQTETQP